MRSKAEFSSLLLHTVKVKTRHPKVGEEEKEKEEKEEVEEEEEEPGQGGEAAV